MTAHCPDEKCHDKVEALQADMIAKNKLLKAFGWGFGLFGIGIICNALIMWSDNRAFPQTYLSIFTSHQLVAESIGRDQLLESAQAGIKQETALAGRDIKYIKDSIDEIKALLKQMRHRDK